MKTKAAALFYDEYGECSITADTVHEGENETVHTGLLDQFGRPITRDRMRLPIGFKLNSKGH